MLTCRAFIDADKDGMDDAWETDNGLNPGDGTDGSSNTDGDDLTAWEEFLHNTLPGSPDTDGDTMSDGDEVANGLDPTIDDASDDPDGDSLTNAQELVFASDPFDRDTDDDGYTDAVEAIAGSSTTDAGDTPLPANLTQVITYTITELVPLFNLERIVLDLNNDGYLDIGDILSTLQ